MIEFASPYFLLLLVLLVPLAWWTLWRPARRQGAIQFSSFNLFASVPAGSMLYWRRVLPALRLAALALFIIAMARPRYGTVERDVIREGVDIMYCLDISGSMQAEDFEPTRLEKAKQLTEQFAARRTQDRQGIVLFAGVSFTLCPMTFDNNTVQEFLKQVKYDDIGVDGTALGMGLARALKKLQTSKAKSKVVILMTDGVNNTGEIDPLQATRVAKEMGVHVYTVAIGSRGATWITVPTQRGPQRQQIQTTVDEALLQKIAQETGGIYGRATNGQELEAILKQIDKLEKTEIEAKEYHSFEERMAWFCWAGLALLLLEILLANTRFLKIP